jgi:hypothetical protein
MKANRTYRSGGIGHWTRAGLFLALLALPRLLQAQEAPRVQSGVDTASIRIGEQIRWTVTVEADTTAVVIFPEGQTFAPLETVEAYKTDTTRKMDRMLLQKTYALTQFDSGAYLLPTQRIEVDGRGFFTDSLLISVATVPVDTVNQKLYDIKPMMEVPVGFPGWLKWLLGILGILLAGGAVAWYFLRKNRMSVEEAEALLPPYERAMRELKRLEQSRYLIQEEYKQYYTELTSIVRAYLEEEVHISALESTTGQLLGKLELLKDAGKLNLDEQTLVQFRKILETADLVKFARSRPELREAEHDRLQVEQIVQKTREALPEPTEEELLQQEAYRKEWEARKKRKKIRMAAVAAGVVLLIALVASVAYFGVQNVKDSLFGNPSKSLLQGEWIASSYGYPPVLLETPEVLVRRDIPLPPEAMEAISDLDAFAYDNPKAHLSISAISTTFNKADTPPDFEAAVDQALAGMERNGARNIITKQEEFTTVSGVKGVKVYGRGEFQQPGSGDYLKGKYTLLLFGGNGFLQQVFLSWEEGDTYAEEIVERILNTVEVKTVV